MTITKVDKRKIEKALNLAINFINSKRFADSKRLSDIELISPDNSIWEITFIHHMGDQHIFFKLIVDADEDTVTISK